MLQFSVPRNSSFQYSMCVNAHLTFVIGNMSCGSGPSVLYHPISTTICVCHEKAKRERKKETKKSTFSPTEVMVVSVLQGCNVKNYLARSDNTLQVT